MYAMSTNKGFSLCLYLSCKVHFFYMLIILEILIIDTHAFYNKFFVIFWNIRDIFKDENK